MHDKHSRGRHRFHCITFLEKYDKHLVKFYSHWKEPKLGVSMYMSKDTPNGWSQGHLHERTRLSLRHKCPTIVLSFRVPDHINPLLEF
jgi:hypothetical protein